MIARGRPVDIPSAKERALLAMLLINAERPVSISRLIDAVWGDDPPRSARNQVHTYVWRLRRMLADAAGEQDRIVAYSSGYLLQAAPDEIDAQRFERLLGDGRRAAALGDVAGAATALHDALATWHGEPLEDVTLHGGYEAEAERLAEQRVTAFELRIDADLALGRHELLIGELRRLTRQHPLRERLVGQLMQALYRSGRRSEALAAFGRLRSQLADELGIDPSPALWQLHQAILRGNSGTGPAAGRPRLTPVPGSAPRQLPRDLSRWVGRDRELRGLASLLEGPDTASPVVISAINGTAGVGKTALAVHWAHSVAERFPDGQLYLSLRGHSVAPAMDPHGALSHLLRSLGTAGDQVPVDTDAAAAMFRSMIAGKRLLVLLDDAASAAQVRPLLPGSPGPLVVITSRADLRGLTALQDVHRITLDAFSPADSAALLAAILTVKRVAAERAAAAGLADVCGHLPLTLRIAAANLLDRPGLGIADYLAELRSADLLSALQVPGDEQTVLRATFSLSYVGLGAGARRVFRLLGVMPGRDVTVPAMAALAEASSQDAARDLGQLVAAHLIREHFPGRFTLHDLLRIYAAELAPAEEAGPAARAAQRRLLTWYLHTADAADRVLMPQRTHVPVAAAGPDCAPLTFGGPQEALDWCTAELPNIVMAIRHAADIGEHALCWRLADAMFGFFTLRRNWADWMTVAEFGIEAARQAGERYGEAAALASLGNCYAESGRLEEGLRYHQQSLEIRHETGDKLECAALINIGVICARLNQLERSIGYTERALQVAMARCDQWGQCIALNNLGEAYGKLEMFEQSVDFSQRALALFGKLGDRYGQGYALDNLGHVYRSLGRLGESSRCLNQALQIRREIGDRHGEAETLRHIGDVCAANGQTERARSAWRKALLIFRDLGAGEADDVRARLAQAGGTSK